MTNKGTKQQTTEEWKTELYPAKILRTSALLDDQIRRSTASHEIILYSIVTRGVYWAIKRKLKDGTPETE